MFTGIVEDIGKVTKIGPTNLSVETALNEIKIGDSISVSGVCLTVTQVESKKNSYILDFDFSPETISKSNIGKLKRGSRVNIERAVKAGGRLGGHFVTGHVEGTGKIMGNTREKNSFLFDLSIPAELMKYVVVKGSVSVDGVSLTVAWIEKNTCTVSIIPLTMERTTLGNRKKGDSVNIETDVMAKYAKKMFDESSRAALTIAKLKRSGFL